MTSLVKQSLLGLSLLAASQAAHATIVLVETSMGNFEINLFDQSTPATVQNFLSYLKDGSYDNSVIHRAEKGFMVQGGGFDANMVEKPNNKSTIKNESYNGLSNTRGTLAMARMNQPDSARSQFFVNLVDNNFLNRSPMNAGYAVFGKVTKGMDVIDKIAGVPTANYGMHQNVPLKPIIINSVSIKTASPQK